MLKIGDEVIYIKHDAYLRGKLGKVIEVCPEDKEDAGVEFYDEINGHNCNGNGRNGYCWYVNSKDLEKTKKDVETCKKCKSEEFCTENETSCFVPEPMEFESKYTGDNSGGSTDYYKLKEDWTDCQDIIEDRKMNFSQGNIFKAAFCFNVGRHFSASYERDLYKIKWFADRELERIKEG